MPFCPECREEYRQEIQICAACNVKLVDELEAEGDPGSDMEVLCTLLQEENAYILRGFLESEGIPCQMENLSFHASPAPVGELTKVRLWTQKEDLEQARGLIEEHERFNQCSSCGHVALAKDDVCDFCGEEFDLD